jgi:pimeloyl-ACP methyl ester carboxylesterase
LPFFVLELRRKGDRFMQQPDILFVHGAFTRAARWQPWVSFFTAAGYRCVAPSLPGHDPPDPALLAKLTFMDYVNAVAEVHRTFVRPPIVIGHSMGGLIAQHLAARAECAALVLVSSTPPWPLRGTRHTLPYLSSYVLPALAGRTIRVNSSAARDLVLHDLAPAEREELLSILAYESGKAYRTMVLGLAPVAAGAVRCPVLCVSGGADRMLAPSVGRRLAKFYGADHIVVPGHGHSLVAASLVGAVAVSVREWLDGLGARAAAVAGDPSFVPVAAV